MQVHTSYAKGGEDSVFLFGLIGTLVWAAGLVVLAKYERRANVRSVHRHWE